MDDLLRIVWPLALVSLLAFGLFPLLTARMAPAERNWLLVVFVVGFILRIGAATLFALVPKTRVFHEDAEGYESIGLAIASSWKGLAPPYQELDRLTNNYGYFYVSAACYYVVGACRVAPSYLNALLGSATFVIVYRLTRRFFHVLVAQRAALLCALIPSMVLWSAMALKDCPVTFLVVLSLFFCVHLKERFSLVAVIGTVGPLIAVQPIRFYMIYFLGFAIVASLLLERGTRSLGGVGKQAMIVGAFLALLAIAGFTGRAQQNLDVFSLERANTYRAGMVSTARSGFAADADISTPAKALAFLPVGLSELLFGPFPWQFTSVRAAFALPEMLVWWYLVPSLYRGLRFAIRRRFAAVSPIVLFAATLTIAYAFTLGNLGAGFRERAQIFVFLFIFTALGRAQATCRRLGVDEKWLLADAAVVPSTTETA